MPEQQIYLWQEVGLSGQETVRRLLAVFDQKITLLYLHLQDTGQLHSGAHPGLQVGQWLWSLGGQ